MCAGVISAVLLFAQQTSGMGPSRANCGPVKIAGQKVSPHMGNFQAVSGLFWPLPISYDLRRFFEKKSYVLTRILQARYFDPHSPCKMADFGVYLVPMCGGRILGPKSGYFQAVFGLFLLLLNL